MNSKLYKLMNWPEIEEIIYSDGKDPHRILGAHKVGGSMLVQCFLPEAEKVEVLLRKGTKSRRYEMELADEAGFFAALLPYQKDPHAYLYEVTNQDGTQKTIADPYTFEPGIQREDCIKFTSGIHYSIYEKLGAHPQERDGIQGCSFAIWAPFVARVSVIGSFNHFDGRIHQMREVDPCGIYEIFIPDVGAGEEYCFEIKSKAGDIFRREDPFAFVKSKKNEGCALITNPPEMIWHDDAFLQSRKKADKAEMPLSICEISPDLFLADRKIAEDDIYLSEALLHLVQENGFNAVEFMPVMEHDDADPYAVTNFFALSSKIGRMEHFMKVIDTLHRNGIRVILDFPATFFSEKNQSLFRANGSPLYEYAEPTKERQPKSGYLTFDFGRKEVVNYLLSCALYWCSLCHVDGLRITDIAKIIYLDYDRPPGGWIPNIYGGNQNLEAEDFVKTLNQTVHKKDSGILMITKETANWPKVTTSAKEGGLGFDYKWNSGWARDFFAYMDNDPLYRSGHHNELVFSLIYHYTEHFLLSFSHEDIGGFSEMLSRMPGDSKQKEAGVRFAIAYLMVHPGRKMIFRGVCEIEADHEKHLRTLMQDLNRLYFEHPALYELDDAEGGFEWINSMAAQECMMSFVRHGKKEEDMLLVVCNMAGIPREFTVGVPRDGKYTEILNTDAKEYGGNGLENGTEVLEVVKREADGREFSIQVKVAASSLLVLRFVPYTAQENKIRLIRHETYVKMEEEQDESREALRKKQEAEEEKLLAELRKKYELEMSRQEESIREKYHKIEAEKIMHVVKASAKKTE